MNTFTHKRRYAMAFTLLLVLVFGSFVYISAAAGPAMIAIPTSMAAVPCTPGGALVPTAVQGSPVSFNLSDFHANEGIAMSFTFPDGHTLNLPAVLAMDGTMNTLNSTVDPTPNVDDSGELYFSYYLNQSWPIGCYIIQAVGQSSGNEGKTGLMIMAAKVDPPFSPLLNVHKEADGSASGVRGDTIVMKGEKFAGGVPVLISVKAPDGTVSSFPAQPLTSLDGKFRTTFHFTQASMLGAYIFTASGGGLEEPSAAFTLIEAPTPPPGIGILNVITTTISLQPPLYKVEVQGNKFNPNDGVKLKLTIPAYTLGAPSSTVVDLPMQRANDQGKFMFVFYLDQGSPTGIYNITGTGSNGKPTPAESFKIPPK